jgi:hypothetical protein
MALWREVKPKRPKRAQPAGRADRAPAVTSEPGSAAEVLALQKAVGNHATSALLAGAGPAVGRPSRAPESSKRKRAAGSPPEGSAAEGQHQRRRSSRLKLDDNVDLDKPTLAFNNSSYDGAKTQKLDATQSLNFHQAATLSKPVGAPQSVDYYYEFRQEVRDGYDTTDKSKDGSKALQSNFVQDGPYKPSYNNEVITKTSQYIKFTDDPGFSTTTKIPSGHWLNWYKVFFRWKVKRKETGKEWTSPVVGHSIESTYDEGKDAPVTARPAGNTSWTVDLS